MADDLMRYDLLAQDALRGVVRRALKVARDEGLPGDHHFYISIRTDAPGVEISEKLRTQYPEEMTIVLQHQFWNLEVNDERFSVELTFNKIPERLVVPFSAVQGFFDPSVQFGLQFQVQGVSAGTNVAEDKATEASKPAEPAPSGENAGEVVSLDAFRKK
ncbi:MAG: ClpXP protease specificity-enhancing factor SspB [Parvibaculum sp.]